MEKLGIIISKCKLFYIYWGRSAAFLTHEISTWKNLDPKNTQTRKIWIHEITKRKKNETHKIPKRKKFGFTKYPREKIRIPNKIEKREKISNSRKTHEKSLWTQEGTVTWWHKTQETHDGTRPTEFSPFFFPIHIKRVMHQNLS